MSDALTFPANARRAVWVFSADLPESDLESFAAAPAEALQRALGLSALDTDHIELFRAETLAEYGLANFLTHANGMDAASVEPDAARLDALTGPVLLVFSGALPAGDTALAPQAPLTFIGRYIEQSEAGLRAAPPMPESAPAPPPPSPAPDARHGGSVLIILAALVLVVLFVLVFGFGAFVI